MRLRSVLSSDLPCTERALLVVLLILDTDAVSLTDLASLLAVDKTTVIRTVRSLQRKGWLTVAREQDEGRARMTNRYDVTVPERWAGASSRAADRLLNDVCHITDGPGA